LGSGLCIFDAGDIKFDDRQVIVLADRRSDSFRVAPGGDDRVAGCQRSCSMTDSRAVTFDTPGAAKCRRMPPNPAVKVRSKDLEATSPA
jgi:hypothetical protein